MNKLFPQIRPVTDIVKLDDRVCVYVELPGVDESNYSLSLTDTTLIVSAKSFFHKFDDVMVHCLEFSDVNYYLELELCEKIIQISSYLHKGLLEINLFRE